MTKGSFTESEMVRTVKRLEVGESPMSLRKDTMLLTPFCFALI